MTAVLQTLGQSDLTLRVGLTLIHALWQGLVAALVLALALRWIRSAAANTRHAIACVALLATLAAPAITFWRLGRPMPPIHDEPAIIVSAEAGAGTAKT